MTTNPDPDVEMVREALAGVLPRNRDPFAALSRISSQLNLATEQVQYLQEKNRRFRRIEEAAREVLDSNGAQLRERTRTYVRRADLDVLRTALEGGLEGGLTIEENVIEENRRFGIFHEAGEGQSVKYREALREARAVAAGSKDSSGDTATAMFDHIEGICRRALEGSE